jgi:hypothetical protein
LSAPAIAACSTMDARIARVQPVDERAHGKRIVDDGAQILAGAHLAGPASSDASSRPDSIRNSSKAARP